MKILLAPNAFKGSLTAAEAAAAMACGVRRAAPDAVVEEVPVADGGDGLHALAADVLGGTETAVTVTGPRGDPVSAGFVLDRTGERAIIEMAQAGGLALLEGRELAPLRATTLGTGELMRAALDAGARHLVVGLGGSATTDGGVGMATAFGWRFLDRDGAPVPPEGGALERIVTIDGARRDARLAAIGVTIVCDVDNPLCGPRGAAAVYGPQKGATPAEVEALDRGLAHLADVISTDTGADVRDTPGAGAAGGLGFGLRVFAGGTLRRGTDVIFEWLDLDTRLADANLVITGEGRLDAQTRMGKAPAAYSSSAIRRRLRPPRR